MKFTSEFHYSSALKHERESTLDWYCYVFAEEAEAQRDSW